MKAIENSDDDVIAIADVKSTFLAGEYDSVDDVFKADGVKYNLDQALADDPDFKDKDDATVQAYDFTNGNKINENAAALVNDNSYTLAVKLSGKTIKEVYSVSVWNSEAPFQFETDMLEDDAINGYDFTLDDDDNIDAKAYSLLGVASLDKIAEDNVVRVYLDNSEIVKLTVGTEKVEGKVTLEDDGDVTIGGKVYSVAADGDAVALGESGTAYLDYNGDIAVWDIDDAASDNYAIVTGDLMLDGRDYSIVLFDKEGNEKEYVVASDATLKTEPATTHANLAAAVASSDFDEDALVTFSLDKNGKIDELNALVVAGPSAGELSATRTIYNNVRVDAGVVVFANDGSDYSVVNLADVETGEPLNGTMTYVDLDNGRIKVMIIDADYTGADSVYAVINSVQDTYNADDDKVQIVKGFADGKAYTAYTDARNVVGAGDWGDLGLGELVITKLSVDSNEVIVKAEPVNVGVLGFVRDEGWVISKSGRDLGLNATSGTGAVTDGYAAIDPNAVVYVINDGDYELGTWSSVRAKTTVAGSYVYLYQIDDDSEVYDFVIVDKDDVAAIGVGIDGALAAAEAAEALLTAANYTDYTAVTAALALPDTDAAEKVAKTTAINNAIGALVFDDVTSPAVTIVAANDTLTITLTNGEFKAGAITAADFTFAGTDAAVLGAGTFVRTSDTVVTVTFTAGAIGIDNVITVKGATIASESGALSVAGVASTI